ncbi:MAG: hypothetical protein OXG88_01145, partial [Gammaproteobacteria bacterium]|nr:hypothetical protein [Gammaproteobacteria bacterium]
MKQIKLKDFPQFISIRYPWHYALPDPDHEIPELRSREKMLEKINEFLVCKPEHFETLKIALGITVGSSERETIGKNILKRIFEGEIRQIPISVIAKKLRELTEPDVRIWQCSKLIDLLSKYCYSVED